MKIIIASDIHGSSFYCDLLVEAFKKEQADRILLLGDILYHGPRNDLPYKYDPKKVIEMLNPLKDCIYCVRGNCDSEVDQMVLEFPIMADYCFVPAENKTIYATHGHIYNTDNLPPLKKGDILLNGHTHVPKLVVGEEFVYINPGSVSIPKENSFHSYLTFDFKEFLWKNLEDNKIYNSYKL